MPARRRCSQGLSGPSAYVAAGSRVMLLRGMVGRSQRPKHATIPVRGDRGERPDVRPCDNGVEVLFHGRVLRAPFSTPVSAADKHTGLTVERRSFLAAMWKKTRETILKRDWSSDRNYPKLKPVNVEVYSLIHRTGFCTGRPTYILFGINVTRGHQCVLVASFLPRERSYSSVLRRVTSRMHGKD